MSAPTQDGRRTASPAVTMAAAVLDVLMEARRGPLGPSEIARRLGVAKSSVANVCTAMAQAGFVRRDGTGYVLGQRLAELGAAYLDRVDEIRVFHDVCEERLSSPEETVQLAVLGPDLDVAHMAQRDGTVRIRLVSDTGRYLPATCTATGKALLASLPPAELDLRLASGPLPAVTPYSIVDQDALRAELEVTRDRGWAVDDQELIEGVVCLAVAVPAARGGPRYAVSFTLLSAWATGERRDRLGHQLLKLAAAMADRLGHGGHGGRA